MAAIISRTINFTDVTIFDADPIKANESRETRCTLFNSETYTLQYDKPLRNIDIARRAVKSYLGHENFVVTKLQHYSGKYELSANWFFLNAKPIGEYKEEYLKRTRMVKASIGETSAKVITPALLANGDEPITVTYEQGLKPRALKKLI